MIIQMSILSISNAVEAVISFLILLVHLISYIDAASCRTITTVSGSHAPKDGICSGDLIFEDQFGSLDLSKWEHENTLRGGGNWEFQWYTNNRSVSYVEDGILHIKPTFVSEEFGESFLYNGKINLYGGTPYDTCTNAADYGCSRTGTSMNLLNPIKSASLRTVHSFAFKYGKVEIRAKTPAGDWLWPILWMMPKYSQYGGWPASGEFVIMESRGNSKLIGTDGVDFGNKMITSTLHFGPNANHNKWKSATFQKFDTQGFSATFHKYQLEWTNTHLTFSVDEVEIGTITPPEGGFWERGNLFESNLENPWRNRGKMAPFDDQFFLIISLAVGGVNWYFPDNADNGNGRKPWKNSSPYAYKEFWEGRHQWEPTWHTNMEENHFLIDYVKVYAI